MIFRFARLFLVLLVIVVTSNIQGCDWLDGSSPAFEGGTRLLLVPEVTNGGKPTTGILQQTVSVIQSRLDLYGIRKKGIQIVGDTRIEVLLPEVKSLERVKTILSRRGYLEMRFAKNPVNANQNTQSKGQAPSSESIGTEALEKEVLLNGSMIKQAVYRIDTYDQPYMQISFTDTGSKRLFEVTSQGIGRRMAIVMDEKVLAAPVIREAISAGEAMVNLPFSGSEIKDLTIVLNSGPYPADVRILEAAPIPASK